MRETKADRTIETLRAELAFMESGKYKLHTRVSWRPAAIFLDSPTCLNFGVPRRTRSCDDCVLTAFVPPDRRTEAIPCHYIPLNGAGDTVQSASSWTDEDELENLVKAWLRSTIALLEQQTRSLSSDPQPPSHAKESHDDSTRKPRIQSGGICHE
jgi:hypothetical protein